MMAMAARPGAVDKAYIVASSSLTRLKDLLTSVGCHGGSVTYFLLAVKGITGLDEYTRGLDICARDFDSISNKRENDVSSDGRL